MYVVRLTITGIDTKDRKITGHDAEYVQFIFYYQPTVSIRRRGSTAAEPLDRITKGHPGKLPFKRDEKVTVTWTAGPPAGRKNAVEITLD